MSIQSQALRAIIEAGKINIGRTYSDQGKRKGYRVKLWQLSGLGPNSGNTLRKAIECAKNLGATKAELVTHTSDFTGMRIMSFVAYFPERLL